MSSARTVIIFQPPLLLRSGYLCHHEMSAAARSPVLSSLLAWSWRLLLRSYHPFLLRICRRKALRVRGPISTHGPEFAVEFPAWSPCALADEVVKGAGTLMSLASCSFAMTGTGPRISATWKSRTKVCRNQVRSRPKKAGLAPKAMGGSQYTLEGISRTLARYDNAGEGLPMNLVPNILFFKCYDDFPNSPW